MAKKLGVAINDIPRKPLTFTLWSPAKGLVTKGSVTFKHNKPKFSRADFLNMLD